MLVSEACCQDKQSQRYENSNTNAASSIRPMLVVEQFVCWWCVPVVYAITDKNYKVVEEDARHTQNTVSKHMLCVMSHEVCIAYYIIREGTSNSFSSLLMDCSIPSSKLNHPIIIIYSSGDHTALSQYSITAAVATPLPNRFRLLLYCGYCIFIIGVSDYY